MTEPPKPQRTSIFYYVPLVVVALLIVVFVFVQNFRTGEEAAKYAPPPSETAKGAAPKINERALAKDTTLAVKGKQLFLINCASCHGPEGRGDGERAASLNPKPRNYHEEKFKFGDDIVSVHNTIMKGSPGTSMPSFALLPVEDTWAIAHFVETQIPNAPPITDSLLAQVPEGGAVPGGQPSTAPGAATASDTNRIPIQYAMELLESAPPPEPAPAHPEMSLPGATIYAQRCESCHGPKGDGGPVRVVSVSPYRYARALPLSDMKGVWFDNRNEFAKIVVKGLPGRLMPGDATLSKQQIDELYGYVRELAGASAASGVASQRETDRRATTLKRQ